MVSRILLTPRHSVPSMRELSFRQYRTSVISQGGNISPIRTARSLVCCIHCRFHHANHHRGDSVKADICSVTLLGQMCCYSTTNPKAKSKSRSYLYTPKGQMHNCARVAESGNRAGLERTACRELISDATKTGALTGFRVQIPTLAFKFTPTRPGFRNLSRFRPAMRNK